MPLHQRFFVVKAASLELETAVSKVVQDHGLTYVEALQALAEIQTRFLKYMLRAERHPNDPERKGDEAPAGDNRLSSCVEQWPECRDGEYNPKCCRFPKECSCG